ncbi:MAG: winged helix-turn-helix domain-containing protein [Acidobacteriota bacterium]
METTNGNKNGHAANGHRYTFDEFEVDSVNRVFLRDGAPVPLTGKVFDLLLAFAEEPSRLLTKDELIERIWRGAFVEEGNLARNVSTLRKALRDETRPHKFIVTVPTQGYRFVGDVSKLNGNGAAAAVPADDLDSDQADLKGSVSPGRTRYSRKWLWIIPLAALLIAAVTIGRDRYMASSNRIRSLAVLPLRSADTDINYLGVGIADAVIRRISQTGELTVRPLSAVLGYAKTETDALTAAHQLNADAVLEGNVQRADDRIRVSVNLLRTSDGVSLWSDSFDMQSADIFRIQDTVAQQVVTRLQPRFDQTEKFILSKQFTTYPIAYEYYVKGVYSLDLRGSDKSDKPQMEETIDFFKKAIEVDPNYALAHAQLAYAYAWTAMFIDAERPEWAKLANKEIETAQALDPQLAEPHVAKALLLWGSYDGFQYEAAIRELLLAQQLNPSVGHADLAAIYQHIGLETLGDRELQRSLEIDPTSEKINNLVLISLWLGGKYDEFNVAVQKMNHDAPPETWYLLRKGRLDDAQKAIEETQVRSPNNPELPDNKALLSALRGDLSAAEAAIPEILNNRARSHLAYHHATYDVACIYALEGKSDEAVKWLKVTAATGFPNYPLFERDAYLDRIRQSPAFAEFIAGQKALWQQHKQEFGA